MVPVGEQVVGGPQARTVLPWQQSKSMETHALSVNASLGQQYVPVAQTAPPQEVDAERHAERADDRKKRKRIGVGVVLGMNLNL